MNQTEITLFGGFQGHDLEPFAYEAMLHTRWPSAERRREPELFTTKWWDYRQMAPAQATYYFAHLFTEHTRKIIREHLNDAPAANGRDWHPIKSGDVFEPPADERRHAYWRRKITGLVRARQAADAEGIPYEVFIPTALRYFYFGGGTYVFAKRGGMMLEPSLLYGEEVMAEIAQAWIAQLEMRVQAARHPRFLLANDDGHPDHQAHRDWLEQQLARRAMPELARRRLVKEGYLP